MTTRAPRAWVIVHDEPDGSLTFLHRDGLVLDWRTCTSEAEARLFTDRQRAAVMLQGSGQNRNGWRVLPWRQSQVSPDGSFSS